MCGHYDYCSPETKLMSSFVIYIFNAPQAKNSKIKTKKKNPLSGMKLNTGKALIRVEVESPKKSVNTGKKTEMVR